MKNEDLNKIRADFLEISSFPYAIFQKINDNYTLVDYNTSFKNYFNIKSLNTDLKDVFINEKEELIAMLNNINSKEKIFIYNNNFNKCLEFNINKINDLYYFIANDCTNLQNMQTAWHHTEALYKAIFNSGTQAIIFIDKSSKIIAYNKYANELALKVFDFQLQINKKVLDLLPDDEIDNFTSHFMESLNGNRVKVERQKEIPDSFKKEWFELIYQIIKQPDSNINGVCLIISNITERKRYEQEMKDLITALKLANKITDENIKHIQTLNEELGESETKLKEMNAQKDKFFSIIAHDLKNPFQGFLGLTKDLADNFRHFNLEELNEYFDTLHKNAKQLFKLLENLLLWSRVQRNSVDFKPETLLLRDLIKLNIDIQKINLERKEIVVQNNVNSEVEVYSDLNMLNTILRNLLSNAIKFTPKGGYINFSTEEDKQFIILNVTDTGVGMDEETIDKLFRIDKQITTKGTENEVGTGLGLILCKELAEKNYGDISVTSELGKGTTFSVKIPKFPTLI